MHLSFNSSITYQFHKDNYAFHFTINNQLNFILNLKINSKIHSNTFPFGSQFLITVYNTNAAII